MNISATITLLEGETAAQLAGTAAELATAVLTAVGGDPATDTSFVTIQGSGRAGAFPEPPVPPPG